MKYSKPKMDLDWMKSSEIINEVNINNTLENLCDDDLLDELLEDDD